MTKSKRTASGGDATGRQQAPQQPAGKRAERPPEELAMLHCPNCSQRLVSRRCRLCCDRCGYFMDCSDYY